jgi:voltage-gated potassium channel
MLYSSQGTHIVPGMDARQRRLAHRLDKPSTVVALLIIPYLLINVYASQDSDWDLVSDILYFGIWGTFLVEVVVMLWLSPNNREWLRHNVLDVVILALTAPFTLFAPNEWEALQCLWLLRVLDVLPDVQRFFFRITVLRFAFIAWGLVVFGGGVAYAILERGQEDPPTLLEGIYWANTVVSTVGFGDFLPNTTATIILTIFLQLMGPVLAAILVAGILPIFDKEFAEGFTTAVAERIERLAGEVDEVEEDVERVEAGVADISADIERMAHGEAAQDRVLAEIATSLGSVTNRLETLDARVATLQAPPDGAGGSP